MEGDEHLGDEQDQAQEGMMLSSLGGALPLSRSTCGSSCTYNSTCLTTYLTFPCLLYLRAYSFWRLLETMKGGGLASSSSHAARTAWRERRETTGRTCLFPDNATHDHDPYAVISVLFSRRDQRGCEAKGFAVRIYRVATSSIW